MSENEGILGPPVQLHGGPAASGFNFVITGDGFANTPADQSALQAIATDFKDALLLEPWFNVIGSVINVWLLPIWSIDSGVPTPAINCVDKQTYFDATYCKDPNKPWPTINHTTVTNLHTNPDIPFTVHAFGIVLNTDWGLGTTNGDHLYVGAGDWPVAAMHEFGHAAFGLGDEYDDNGTQTWASAEPSYPNLTIATTIGALKWRWFVDADVAVPTLTHADCSIHTSNLTNPLGDPYRVGLFQGGAAKYTCGIFHPVFSCKMNADESEPYCRVCLDAGRSTLRPFVSPVPVPHAQLDIAGGGTTLEFGSVAFGQTMYRAFEMRNTRIGFPEPLDVSLPVLTAPFQWVMPTTSFMLPGPVLDASTSRTVVVGFTAPQAPGEFSTSVTLTTSDPANASFVLDLHATAVPPMPVDTVLVIDRSGSMADPTGTPNKNKSQVAIDAANLFVALLRDNDQVGLVRYNQTSDVLLSETLAGAPGNGKALATAALTPANLAPDGSTSIGAGIIEGSDVLDAGTDASRAIVVLTDGLQNTAPDITQGRQHVQTKNPAQRVFAVGLGLNQLQSSLSEIASVTNGYAQITGDLSGPNEFLLQKLYVQILADAANQAFVTDPRRVLPPGEEQSVDVQLSEVDVEADFIVVFRETPVHPKYTEVWLETPDGSLLTAADAGTLPNLAYAEGDGHLHFRMQFPPFPAQPGGQAGRWRIWVANRWKDTEKEGERGDLFYAAMCKAESDLRLLGRIEQEAYEPESEMRIVLAATLSGQPTPLAYEPVVTVRRPDDRVVRVKLREEGGRYVGLFSDTGLVGRYLASTEVVAVSPAGHRVTRYRDLTGVIFRRDEKRAEQAGS